METLSSGTQEQLVSAYKCLALKCDSTPDADDPKKLLHSALHTHLRELPIKKAAQTFLDNVFLSYHPEKQAALLLDVVKHACIEFGAQEWVKKAVEAFDSFGEPQDLVKVCKLHMDLVKTTSIDPQQKSDLEKLLFALQTHLRTPDPMRRAELLSQIALNAKEKHGNRFGKEYKSTPGQIDQYLDAYIKDWRGDANQPFLREDNKTTRTIWHFWDTRESVVALRDDLVDLLVVAAAQAAKKLEGLPLNGPKVQADLLTEGQMKIMLEELTPLFTKLFSAETARALSPDTCKLMQLIQDKVNAKEINASAAILFFLRLIAPTFLTVNAEAVNYDSQGLLQREIAFMKFAGQLIQKLVDDPLNPLANLGLTPGCKNVVSDWLRISMSSRSLMPR